MWWSWEYDFSQKFQFIKPTIQPAWKSSYQTYNSHLSWFFMELKFFKGFWKSCENNTF